MDPRKEQKNSIAVLKGKQNGVASDAMMNKIYLRRVGE
jgi:hypothetical protein